MKRAMVPLVLAASAFVVPCCSVSSGSAPVLFTGQTNIVVWDAERRTEHFVRDARFATGRASLAFIAPTPGKPTLSAVSARAFASLEALRPKEPTLDVPTASATKSAAMPGAIEVLGVQNVAGYRATILRATDAASLTTWLRTNGYPSPPFLTKWAAPYVRRGWTFTAFKVNGDATGPVRMSFHTDRPYNPYSVPAENGGHGVPLRLYYVSAGREVPKVGGTDAWRSPAWSAAIPEETRSSLAWDLKLSRGDIPEGARVTAYDDSKFGTPGLDDLYFVPDHSMRNSVGGGAVATVLLVAALRRKQRRAPNRRNPTPART